MLSTALLPLQLEPISFGARPRRLVPAPRFNLVPAARFVTPRFNLVPAARFVTPPLLKREAPLGGLALGDLPTHLMREAIRLMREAIRLMREALRLMREAIRAHPT